MTEPESKPASARAPAVFATTRWSVVLAARGEVSPDSAAALEILCRSYWFPLYAQARRLGHAPADAEDLTQEFFARLIARDWLQAVEPDRGRFRTFLLVAFKRFLANEHRAATAGKRGGTDRPLPLDLGTAETRYAIEPAAAPDDAAFDRQWALQLLDAAVAQVEEDYNASGRAAEFTTLKPTLTSDRGAIDYPALATVLGTNEGAVRVAVHRLRKRFHGAFRELVAATVALEQDLDDEIRHLAAALAAR